MREIELKFEIDDPTLKRLRAQIRASKLSTGASRTRTLRSTYFDTPEHALRAAGFSLRLRRDGRRWIQTVKTTAAPNGGLTDVGEVENPAPGGRLCLEAIPDETIRDTILHAVNGSALQPVCETVIRRQAKEVTLEDGTRAELAIDVGEIHAGERTEPLREAEIELIEGDRRGLFDIAHLLFPDGGLRFSRLSKSARGFLLAERGWIDPPLAPRNAQTVPLDPNETAELAARDILRECFDQVATNMVVMQRLDDPEGPHQLRVGLRRLRSAFSVFAPVLKSPEMSRLEDEARWLGHVVGGLRDLDVVTNDIIRREAETHPDQPGLAALDAPLRQHADAVRKEVAETLTGARAQAFVLDLTRFVETRGWILPADFDQSRRLATPIARLAETALAGHWKKAGKCARRIEKLTVEQRHDLRKELKKLRYAVDFLSPLYSRKAVDPFRKRLRKIQNVLGALNDSVIVAATLESTDLDAIDDRQVQRAIGWVIGASQARAEGCWEEAKARWRDLEESPQFWKKAG
ncbi:CYTH and CHAD domain-containing protein [Bauldia litoralis]|uniref:Inorganic triphosphatase YgiF, contains CYTH and CHAD domains n=1 Tax=Bauldia litoralis TaxID=665467 RepID=A0A1G6DQN6_9HYPH|nr:CHAD domain-containing protein [Bauldia litoralis]SDB47412.1 Inorganic triphosphatase YgiF, contains CYTH and CHAD domains [Bauldia litoralis]